jgi:hypothetical protein
MKKSVLFPIIFTVALASLARFTQAAPLGTAFTYEGHLTSGTNPAHGHYDFTFKLFDASAGPTQHGSTLTNPAVVVTKGLFTTELDFGAGIFDGTAYWLEIGVRTNLGGSFTTLVPRQSVTPSPYAIFSPSAGTAGSATTAGTATSVAANGVSGGAIQNGSITAPKIALGQVVKSLNGLHDDITLAAGLNLTLTPVGNTLTFDSPTWSLTGNAGTSLPANFLGTTDNQPLDLKANGQRGLELQYSSVGSGGIISFGSHSGMNVLGGYWGNTISNAVVGATIAGGGNEAYSIFFGPSYYPNVVTADFGSVGGGYLNTAAYAGTVPGGYNNSALGNGSFAAGRNAHVNHDGSFMWGDGSTAAYSTGANSFEVLASGAVNFFNGAGGVNIDMFNGNNGDINYSLRFGSGSGEGIGSKRSAGGNLYGLDFYTGFNNRMQIFNDGTTSFYGTTRINDNDLWLRANGDSNHGLAYRGTVAGIFFDGPFLWGYQGGALGTVVPDEVSLKWDYNGNVWVNRDLSAHTISIRGGADLAEPFQITPGKDEVPVGAVVVIDDQNPGHLTMSDQPYDTRVAGIVSGANGINSAIKMEQLGVEGGQSVALSGRVYALADASAGPIKPGDLLTTSSVPGHAMKVTDHGRAQGAVLGKAMTGLKEGRGLVLVLVSLQ